MWGGGWGELLPRTLRSMRYWMTQSGSEALTTNIAFLLLVCCAGVFSTVVLRPTCAERLRICGVGGCRNMHFIIGHRGTSRRRCGVVYSNCGGPGRAKVYYPHDGVNAVGVAHRVGDVEMQLVLALCQPTHLGGGTHAVSLEAAW